MPELVKTSWLDRAAMAISPKWGMGRLHNKANYQAGLGAGYVVPGSSRKSMKGVTARANSPDIDQIPKLDGTRALSRDLAMNSALAIAILRRHKISNIGSGLQLQSAIDYRYLGMDLDAAIERQRDIEREFDLWATSTCSDFDGINDFGLNQSLGYFNMLQSGDFFWMPVWREPEEAGFPYQLAIKLIDADLVRNPDAEYWRTSNVRGGVEKDDSGRVVAYHVWNCYPYELDRVGSAAKCTRIPVYDSTGRQQIFHVMDPERIGQRRGIPILANSADNLKQLTRLSEAQLMTSLINSYFTVFVKDISGMGALMGEGMTPNETVTGGGVYGPNEAPEEDKHLEDANDLEMGIGNIVYLDDQKEITVADPRKTDDGFERFWAGIAAQITASTNMPVEKALMHYETSYTAARAAANDAWQATLSARTLMVRKFCQPVLREFMTESIIRGRIEAPGFFDDYATMQAWTRSTWIGSARGSLDPLREAKASGIELGLALTNHDNEYAAKHGGRWDQAFEKLEQEQARINSSGMFGQPDPSELTGPDGVQDEDEDTNAAQDGRPVR